MSKNDVAALLNREALEEVFPRERSDQFFEALFGDSSEGSFDIQLTFAACNAEILELEFQLKQRPGKCLACNLTTGLPQVFSRHPIIDIPGIVEQVVGLINGSRGNDWELGRTRQVAGDLHVIPLTITLDQG